MYEKFKNCLFKPLKIGEYAQKNKGVFIYILLLLAIYCIPEVVLTCMDKTVDNDLIDYVCQTFQESNPVSYKIENGKLVSTDTLTDVDMITLSLEGSDTAIYLVYSTDGNYVDNFNSIKNKITGTSFIAIFFNEEEITYGFFVNGTEIQGIKNTIGYDKYEIDNIDFSKANELAYDFDGVLAGIINNIYWSIKSKFIVVIAIVLFISLASSLMLYLLFFSLIEKLFARRFGLSFGLVFKTIVYSATPYVILNMLSRLCGYFGLDILEYVLDLGGFVLLVVYSSKAIFSTKLQTLNQNPDEVEVMPGIFMKKKEHKDESADNTDYNPYENSYNEENAQDTEYKDLDDKDEEDK